jgi:hypothetical protein
MARAPRVKAKAAPAAPAACPPPSTYVLPTDTLTLGNSSLVAKDVLKRQPLACVDVMCAAAHSPAAGGVDGSDPLRAPGADGAPFLGDDRRGAYSANASQWLVFRLFADAYGLSATPQLLEFLVARASANPARLPWRTTYVPHFMYDTAAARMDGLYGLWGAWPARALARGACTARARATCQEPLRSESPSVCE